MKTVIINKQLSWPCPDGMSNVKGLAQTSTVCVVAGLCHIGFLDFGQSSKPIINQFKLSL